MPSYNELYKRHIYETQGLLLEELGCELCGRMAGMIFDRHHIIFKSEMGFHPEVNNPRNIVQVCRLCHDGLHGKRISRKKLIEERNLEELFNKKFHDKH